MAWKRILVAGCTVVALIVAIPGAAFAHGPGADETHDLGQDVDYDLVLDHAPLIIDTRGTYRDHNGKVHPA